MAYERLCKNWLASYLKWTLSRTESPESYLIFSGLFCIAAALRRNVSIPKSYLGGWTCYPHVYAVLVGPAGEVRKTTAMNQAVDILSQLPALVKGPNIVTQAALLGKIVGAEENAIYMTAKEMSDLIMKSGPEMYEFLTSMFDGDKHFEATTIGRGVEFATAPCVNMIAATTPEWLSTSMPEAAIGGGFASRCIFIYEDKPRYKKLFYNDVKHDVSLDKLEADLVADLKHIVAHVKGDFTIEPDALAYMEDWYQKLNIPKGSKLAGYIARKPTHTFKLAMLLAICSGDKLVLTKQLIMDALTILDAIEPGMHKVFEGVGRNTYALSVKSVVAYVAEHKKVERSTLLRVFNSLAEPNKLDEILNGLINARYLLTTEIGGVLHYSIDKV